MVDTHHAEPDPIHQRAARTPENRAPADRLSTPWLLRHKITVPGETPHYVHRPDLVAKTTPTAHDRRLTVLKASSGFGKTTLLAKCARSLRDAGVPTAWLTLDPLDHPVALDEYIAYACHEAGLAPPAPDALADVIGGPFGRLPLLAEQIQLHGEPFVLALDRIEHLTDPESVALVEYLLTAGPDNLYLCLSGHQLPDGLSAAATILAGDGIAIGADELRFTKPDIARYYEGKLGRKALAREMDQTLGWPFAVSISRLRRTTSLPDGSQDTDDLARNWIEKRILAALTDDQRALLLDISPFDYIEPDLLDTALDRTDTERHLRNFHSLNGLLYPTQPPARHTTPTWRLHPILRQHCAEALQLERPDRYRTIHRTIADAHARRHQPMRAMHHAAAATDPDLLARILQNAGGVRLWALRGFTHLRTADRLLTPELLRSHPRLMLVRCATLAQSGAIDEARQLFPSTPDLAAHPELMATATDEEFTYLVDHCFVCAALYLYGAQPLGPLWHQLLQTLDHLIESDRLDAMTTSLFSYGSYMLHTLKAEFIAAKARLDQASALLDHSPYMAMVAQQTSGQTAMLRGHVNTARDHYLSARRICQNNPELADDRNIALTDSLLLELALECNRTTASADPQGNLNTLLAQGAIYNSIASAGHTAIETHLRNGKADFALHTANHLVTHAKTNRLPALHRFFSAKSVSVLIATDSIGPAEAAWKQLPNRPKSFRRCLDLTKQSWRELETISLARIELLIASRRYDEARSAVDRLRTATRARGLTRTFVRATVASLALEHATSHQKTAMSRLRELLDLFPKTPYYWPIYQHRDACIPVLKRLADHHSSHDPDGHGRLATDILNTLEKATTRKTTLLSARERQVLELLHERDKDIAAALNLTVDGVRYHIRHIFEKLDVHSRRHAQHRASHLGILPPLD